MPNTTEELYVYIGKLYRALSNAMDTVGNLDNGDNCPYCGDDYNFDHPELVYNCENPDCEGNEAQAVLNEVGQACNELLVNLGYIANLFIIK